MKKYEFRIILKDIHDLTEELADRLFAAGCDDGTPVLCDGVVSIDFHREATSLEEAIRSAAAHVEVAGEGVERVEIGADAVAQTMD